MNLRDLSLRCIYVSVLVLGLICQSLQAETIEANYSFTFKGVSESFLEDNVIVTVEGLSCNGEVGSPDLPMKRIKLLLPEGYDFESVAVKGTPRSIEGRHNIVPAQRAIPISADKVERRVDRNMSVYKSDVPFPANLCREGRVFTMRGYRIYAANLYPVQYVPRSGELLFYDNLTVEVTLKPAKTPRSSLFRGLEADRMLIAATVDNPHEVETYRQVDVKRDQIDGIVVTNSAMKPAFDEFVRWKKEMGLTLEIALISTILSSSSGVDNADKLRNYIIKEYKERGITFVVLGGDVSVVPYRIMHNNSTLNDYMKMFPCDLYFSGLDGTWDDNGNGYYGEFHKDTSDYYGDVFVGRITVETPSEAAGVIAKIKKFESTPRPERVFLQSSMMDDTNSSRDVKEGNEYTDSVGCHYYVPDHYEVQTLYQEDGQNTNANYVKGWNSGALMLNHCGHGLERSYSVCRRGDHFGNSNASALLNDVYPIHASISCLTGSFDWETDDCLAEKLLLNPNGGVVSTVQNSRNGLYSYGNALKHSGELDIELYKRIFEDRVPSLGHAVQLARQEFANNAWYNSSYNQVVYVWNLIGDPTLKVLDEETPNSLTLLYPNEGDTLFVDKEYEIQWKSTGETKENWKITIEVCTTGNQGDWDTIATDEVNDGTCSWTVPKGESDKCVLKLTAIENGDSKAERVSKLFFIKSGVSVLSLKETLKDIQIVTKRGRIEGSIPLESKCVLVKLQDVRGREIEKVSLHGRQNFSFPALQSGVYFISMESGGDHFTRKVVVK